MLSAGVRRVKMVATGSIGAPESMLAGFPLTPHDQFFGMQLDAVGFSRVDASRCRFTRRQ